MGEDPYDECLYAPTAKSVTQARKRATELTQKWGYPESAEDVGLLVSELATNAVRHGRVPGRRFRVEVAVTGSVLRVAVVDARGERRPGAGTVPAPGDRDEHGRGLMIVGALAARWDVERLDVGKRIWAELDL